MKLYHKRCGAPVALYLGLVPLEHNPVMRASDWLVTHWGEWMDPKPGTPLRYRCCRCSLHYMVNSSDLASADWMIARDLERLRAKVKHERAQKTAQA
jgi:hypothetical protein